MARTWVLYNNPEEFHAAVSLDFGSADGAGEMLSAPLRNMSTESRMALVREAFTAVGLPDSDLQHLDDGVSNINLSKIVFGLDDGRVLYGSVGKRTNWLLIGGAAAAIGLTGYLVWRLAR